MEYVAEKHTIKFKCVKCETTIEENCYPLPYELTICKCGASYIIDDYIAYDIELEN